MANSRLVSEITGRKIARPGEAGRYFREVVIPYEGEECLLWPFSCDGFGYGQIYWNGRVRRAHRVLCILTHGEPPTRKHEAAHRCGRGHEGCVNKRHIEWDTRHGNQSDRRQHGTHITGERHGMSKLTVDQVREIRSLEGRLSLDEIGAMYGINRSHVNLIHRRKRWRNLL